MTVRQLLAQIDAEELAEQMAYDLYIDPMPDPWVIGASIQKTLWDTGFATPSHPVTFEDFMPKTAATIDEERDILLGLAAFDRHIAAQDAQKKK